MDERESLMESNDSDIPIGNTGPTSRWLVYMTALAWVFWLGFLLFMLASRPPTSAV